ncbi:MAG: DEAD/DEAH box helicase family protein [Desulfurococcales archaeon]|nr:DEAD/DEAH box helicase family protein [Desulfurococcales archaeon]
MSNDPNELMIIEEFNRLLSERMLYLSGKPIMLKKYQSYVAQEILRNLRSNRFIIVSMPTGSGKTLLEEFTAYYAIKYGGYNRVLVVEPTRFLCDQMFKKQWSKTFDNVGKEYEGECGDFLDPYKKIVIATPMTSLKCVENIDEKRSFDFIIIDEVHHAFGNKYYQELLKHLNPKILIGFTALLPSEKILRGEELIKIIGTPILLHYDFKKLKDIDPDFDPPLAIADIYESYFSDDEIKIYDELLKGNITKDPKIDAFLERTFVKYGRKALCESYENLLARGKIVRNDVLERFCREPINSHKVRTLIEEVVNSYDIPQEGKLTLIYTGRIVSAEEVRDVLSKRMHKETMYVLTGQVSKDERIKLIDKLKKGEISVLISTKVGNEGIDIPEAWLLVIFDVSKSPLEFYQRIGRLIRVGSPEKIKHLVLILTPGTFEYDDLGEVFGRLYEEGVDISYIITETDLTGKTTIDHVINSIAKIQEKISIRPSISYLILGREAENKNIIKNIEDLIKSKDEETQKILENIKLCLGESTLSDKDLQDLIFIVSALNLICSNEFKPKILEKIGISKIEKIKKYKLINNAFREGKLYHIYDENFLADIVRYEINRMYNKCIPYHPFFILNTKDLLRYFTQPVLPKELSEILNEMNDKLNKYRNRLEELKSIIGVDKDNIYAEVYSNPQTVEKLKTLIYEGWIALEIKRCPIHLPIKIYYYDIDLDKIKDKEKIKELFKLNIEIALYKALTNFLEDFITSNIESTI